MFKPKKTFVAAGLLALAGAMAMPISAFAETITIQSVVVPATPGQSDTFALTMPVFRSNYIKRLADMLDQINLASSRGWISAAQTDELEKWHADLVKEENLLRQAGGGIISRQYVDQMERHVNGLSYVMARYMNSNPQIAGKAIPVY